MADSRDYFSFKFLFLPSGVESHRQQKEGGPEKPLILSVTLIIVAASDPVGWV